MVSPPLATTKWKLDDLNPSGIGTSTSSTQDSKQKEKEDCIPPAKNYE